MSHKWDLRFLQAAGLFASWSKDPSTRVGAVLVDVERRIIGEGYNGFPRGVRDDADRYDDRPTKHAMVVHAELNAILTAVASARSATLYCTHPPCCDCAGAAIQAGVKRVVVPYEAALDPRWTDSVAMARTMFSECGIVFEVCDDRPIPPLVHDDIPF